MAPVEVPLAAAMGAVLAHAPIAVLPIPADDRAAIDGFALRSGDLSGASPYAPLALAAPPRFVSVGDPLPEGCDCVLDGGLVEQAGPLALVIGEARPGEGVRRRGADMGAGDPLLRPGARLGPLDALLARNAGLERMLVRRPRLRLVEMNGAAGGPTLSLVAALAAQATAILDHRPVGERQAFAPEGCDALLTIGGTGTGSGDATASRLADAGWTVHHGIALQPGRTSAVGRQGDAALVALPGSPDAALAAWLVLVEPLLRHLSSARPSAPRQVRLSRKIASDAGHAELALLAQTAEGTYEPLTVGALPLHALRDASAWTLVPAGSEGHPAGATIPVHPLPGRP
ncbi:molybdopterin-binding protein [Antarcticirhabdus aurantiaca]|uniref:Molybdopterin-binding protein n=1 Tax=Antarcticirhabdus aurantiaca TaxID=2606717 RepID=A0ACD4NVB1_9HYPH|nr:molybdopterin-binding protein [Jeongeuplla avenae]